MKRISSLKSTETLADSQLGNEAYQNVETLVENLVTLQKIATAIDAGDFSSVETLVTEPLQSAVLSLASNISVLQALDAAYPELHGIYTNVVPYMSEILAGGQILVEADKGAPLGICPLGDDSLIPSQYLPSYVDDVIEAATFADLPETGEAAKLYVVVDDETQGGNTASTYRWSGSMYTLISNNVSATDMLNLIKSVDGSGSDLDADTVDSVHASQFVRNDLVNTAIEIADSFDVNGSGPNDQRKGLYAANLGTIQGSTLNPLYTVAICAQLYSSRSIALSVDNEGYLWGFWSHSTAGTYIFQSKVKEADNAQTVGGVDSSNLPKLDAGNIFTESNIFSNDSTGTIRINKSSGSVYSGLEFTTAGKQNFLIYTKNDGSGDLGFQTRNYDTDGTYKATVFNVIWATGVLDFIKTPTVLGNAILHKGNMGANSGIDADLVRGITPDKFVRTDIVNIITKNLRIEMSNPELDFISGYAGDGKNWDLVGYGADGTFRLRAWNEAGSSLAASFNFYPDGRLLLDGAWATKLGTLNNVTTFLHLNRNDDVNAVLYVNQIGDGDIARFYKGASSNSTHGTIMVSIKNDGTVKAEHFDGLFDSAGSILDGSAYASFPTGLSMTEIPSNAIGQATIYGAMLTVNHNANRGWQLAGDKPGRLWVRGIEANATNGFNPWYKVWTELSDGANSGLDADLVDGLQASQFIRNDIANTKIQRNSSTSANDGTFDCTNGTPNFTCTPTSGITLDFGNYQDGAYGKIYLDNSAGVSISTSEIVLRNSTLESDLSSPGKYVLDFTCQGGNVWLTYSHKLLSATAANSAPVASNDSVTLDQDGSVDIDVLTNDSDSDGTIDVSTVTIVTDVLHGSTSVAASGIITYTPTTGYSGADSFTYTVQDNAGAISNPATVTITVQAISTTAFSDDFSTDTTGNYTVEDTFTAGGVGSFNYDSGAQRLNVLTGDDIGLAFSHNVPVITEGSFSIDFRPVTYYPSGGRITLRLIKDVGNYYLIGNTDNYGSEEIAKYVNGVKVDSVPFANEYTQGVDYTITVDFSPAVTTVHAFGETLTMSTDSSPIAVNSFSVEAFQQDIFFDNIVYSATGAIANIPPVASDDSVTVTEDGSVDIAVLANDSDSDGNLIADTVSIVTAAANGSTLVNANGTVTYTPTPGYSGSDSFRYTVQDNTGAVSNTATVSITVTAASIAFAYDLEAPLQAGTGNDTGYYMVLNSDTGSYDARITNADGTAPDAATNWSTVYPENGRIVGPYYIEPANQPTGSFDLFYTRFVDVDGAGKWQDVLLSYDSASSTADVTVGDEVNSLDTTPVYSQNGLTYSPPAMIRFGDDFLLPGIPNATWGLIKNLDVGQTDRFYITFITPPVNFSLANLNVPAEVSVSNLVEYGWAHKAYVYGFDVTGVSAGSASITFEGSNGQVSDSFGNLSTADSQSPTFAVSSTNVTYYLSLDLAPTSIAGPSGVTINNPDNPNDTTQYALLDSSGNDTGSTFQITAAFDGYYDGVGVNTGDDSGVLFDRMFEDSYRAKYNPGVIDLQLPAGVCTITASGSGAGTNFNYDSECECFDSSGTSQGVDGYNTNSNVSDYAQWTNIVSDGINPIRIKALDGTISSSGDRCLLGGLIITWSAS